MFLARNLPPQRSLRICELGGKLASEFHGQILQRYPESVVENVEYNRSVYSKHRDIASIQGSYDIFLAYFVFEHLPNPKAYCDVLSRMVKKSGVVIVEVPDLTLYPRDASGLSCIEHLSHFSPHSLASLFSRAGFAMTDLSWNLCSRPFGFAAAFHFAGDSAVSECVRMSMNILYSRQCVMEGMEKLNEDRQKILDVRDRIDSITKRGGTVLVWGANSILLDLIEDWEIPSGVIL